MSRITPPVTKFSHAIRSMSSSASRSSTIVDNSRHVSIYLPRKLSDLRAECNRRQLKTNGSKLELIDRLTANDLIGSRDFHTLGGRRPASGDLKPIPLMQGFQTSAPKQAAHDKSTIDSFTFPEVPEPPPTTHLRGSESLSSQTTTTPTGLQIPHMLSRLSILQSLPQRSISLLAIQTVYFLLR